MSSIATNFLHFKETQAEKLNLLAMNCLTTKGTETKNKRPIFTITIQDLITQETHNESINDRYFLDYLQLK